MFPYGKLRPKCTCTYLEARSLQYDAMFDRVIPVVKVGHQGFKLIMVHLAGKKPMQLARKRVVHLRCAVLLPYSET